MAKNVSSVKASRRVQPIYQIIIITIINLATDELTGGFPQDLHNLSKRTNKQAIIRTYPPSAPKHQLIHYSFPPADTNGSVHKYHEAPINSSFVG